MKAIKFNLSGKTGFFKKPDVNVNVYFTYNNIHKIALLGVLGAVIGLGGYAKQNKSIQFSGKNKENIYPEFYDKLKNLKVAIKPSNVKNNSESDENEMCGYFTKKIQVFNNSVGYASDENGKNLIVREQWLEKPCWDIYILNDESISNNIFNKLADYLLNNKSVYIPYLGKNDHPAVIDNVRIVNLQALDDIDHIDTLFKEEDVELSSYVYDEDKEAYMLREFSPIRLNENNNCYEFEKLCYTTLEIEDMGNIKDIYSDEDTVIAFI
ncbi:type I-B CRISPR-associated protein Cas5 [Clostridium sporogenes]|uniref:type I-B CRISPR-associated protein Cas5b n=1 Tax=Clostridium sporogenes TaxID=1509 RepID=UPI0013D27AAF|nr:type I-B CRISPR-associated protein Cas5b [Clostridium sporogenes]NFV11669.1 type I-B CRISPR-associated protein Cas5 [Clostridium sporogenes]